MAKFDTSFNFGANRKPKKPRAGGKGKGGKKGGAWAAYVGGKRKR
jgi:hypothetical protein